MRAPTYLSPSSLSKFEKDLQEFYLVYCSPEKPPRTAQTRPMSVGSAFDAHVKSSLYFAAFGNDENFSFQELFEKQVEPHNRDFALQAGKHVFQEYVRVGAYDRLHDLLKESAYAPEFEFEVKGEVEGVPLLGRPDCRFIHKNGLHIIFDWKVSGYCSGYTTSPAKFYVELLDGKEPKAHKHADIIDIRGYKLHNGSMESIDKDWAAQLATYAWLLGEPVGGDCFIGAIDQVVCKPTGGLPSIRVALHRAKVSREYQLKLMERYKTCWNRVRSECLLEVETQRRLDRYAKVLRKGDGISRYLNSLR